MAFAQTATSDRTTETQTILFCRKALDLLSIPASQDRSPKSLETRKAALELNSCSPWYPAIDQIPHQNIHFCSIADLCVLYKQQLIAIIPGKGIISSSPVDKVTHKELGGLAQGHALSQWWSGSKDRRLGGWWGDAVPCPAAQAEPWSAAELTRGWQRWVRQTRGVWWLVSSPLPPASLYNIRSFTFLKKVYSFSSWAAGEPNAIFCAAPPLTEVAEYQSQLSLGSYLTMLALDQKEADGYLQIK